MYQEKKQNFYAKMQNLMISHFFWAPEFCFDAKFEVAFFEEMAISLRKGDHNFNKKLKLQILHQKKIQERQKNSKS